MERRASLIVVAACGLTVACRPTVLGAEQSGGVTGAGAGGASASAGTGAGATIGGAGGGGAGGASGAGAGSGTGAASGSGSGGPTQWAKAFGVNGHQHLRGLASDAQGDVILAGSFDGDIDFGGGPLPQTGLHSSFAAKLDAAGSTLWSTGMTADDCEATAAAVDAAGDVIVTGFVEGTLVVGGQAVSGGDGIFVVKLDPSGSLSWARTYGTSAGMSPDRGLAVAVDPAGDIVVSGAFAPPIDFGGGPLSGGSAFVIALDPGGDYLQGWALPGDAAYVATGASGQVIVAENRAGGVMAVTAFDATGDTLWASTYSPGSFAAVTLDATGDVLLAGSTTTADFGGGPLADPLPDGEGFVAKLDPTGAYLWAHGLPFDQHQSAAVAVAVDAAGDAAVTGSYVHDVDPSDVIQSAFLVKLDPGGKSMDSETFGPLSALAGDTTTQEGWGVAPAQDGFYLGGDFYTEIDVAQTVLTDSGSSDVFVAKLTP
jgi:hypothetical protein